MNSSTKKTWSLFVFIAFIGVITFASALSITHSTLLNEQKTQQRYVNELFNTHITSAFFQFESMLDLISYAYNYQHSLNIKQIDKIL